MDLVYIVKADEKNEDLKYSLRSVAKFVPHDKIWIIGYKPTWVTNVEYLPVAQNLGNKWKNSVNNIIQACNCDKISENFILMNDDFFAIKPIENLEESINLSLGNIDSVVAKHKRKKVDSNWGKAFVYIDQLLESLGVERPYYNYESHTPMMINRNKYLEIMNLPKVKAFMKTSKVLHKRSLYGNLNKTETKVLYKDVKLSQKRDDTLERAKICDWISVYDNQVGNTKFLHLNSMLRNLFPTPCEYEKIRTPKYQTKTTNLPYKTNKYF